MEIEPEIVCNTSLFKVSTEPSVKLKLVLPEMTEASFVPEMVTVTT